MKKNIIKIISLKSKNIYFKKIKKKENKKIKLRKFDKILKKHCIHVEEK